MSNTAKLQLELLTSSGLAKYNSINRINQILDVLIFPKNIILIDSLPSSIPTNTLYLISATASAISGNILFGNGGKVLVNVVGIPHIFSPEINTVIGSFTSTSNDWVKTLLKNGSTVVVDVNTIYTIPSVDGFSCKFLVKTGVTATFSFTGTINGSTTVSTGVHFISVSGADLFVS
jgi:hypothetical protein